MSEQYEPFEDEFPEQNRTRRQFAKTLDTIKRLFPDIAGVSRWGNRADYYSLFVAIGNLLRDRDLPPKNEKDLTQKLREFAGEVDQSLYTPTARAGKAPAMYARAIEKGSNDKARRLDRHEALVELISPFLKAKK